MDARREFHRARAREHAARGRAEKAERHRARARFGADAGADEPRKRLYDRVREEMPYVGCVSCGQRVMGPVFEKYGEKTKCPGGHTFSTVETKLVLNSMNDSRKYWDAEEGAPAPWPCTSCSRTVYGIGDLSDDELQEVTCAFCGYRHDPVKYLNMLKLHRDNIVAARPKPRGTCAVM
jgi:DNA-directed RNA polymerase subunit RPC12/RpoP